MADLYMSKDWKAQSPIRHIVLCVVIIFAFYSSTFANNATELKHEKWPFDGPFGTFDREAIQRGFKIHREVCSACHAVNRIAFRNLLDIGFSKGEAETIAADYNVQDGPNDEGEMYERPAKLADHIPGPFPNEKAARASNNGAYPPDLSLIIKAREGGPDYVYSILTGFKDAPPSVVLGDNMHYNPYFTAGSGQIAMPPPLVSEGQVEYTDGVKPTVDQMAKDVVTFLQWAAEPEMEDRKSLGVRVLIFTVLFTIALYLAKRSIWARLRK